MIRSKHAMAGGVVVMALVMAVVVAARAMAQDAPSGKWWRSQRVAKALNLSPDEIQRLEQAFERSRPRMIDQKNRVELEQFELARMMEQRNLDEGAIRAQNHKLQKARSDLADARVAFVIDVRRIIGPRRFQQLLDLRP